MAARQVDDQARQVILRRAALPESTAPLGGSVSVGELMEAAREAGLDPGEVRRAAAIQQTPSGGPTVVQAALGAPNRRTLKAFLPGAALPESSRHVVAAVEAHFGEGSVQDDLPDRLVWKEDHTLGRTTLEVVGSREGAEVSIRTDRAGHFLGMAFGGFAVWSILAGLLLSTARTAALAVVLGYLVVPFVLARPFWTAADRRVSARLDAAMMDVLRALDGAPVALPPPDAPSP